MLMAQRSRDPDDDYEEEEDFDDEEGEEEAVLLSADTASFYEEARRDANGNLSLTYRCAARAARHCTSVCWRV